MEAVSYTHLAVEIVLQGPRAGHDARPALGRLDEQLDLGVVPQRLEMPDAPRGRGHRLAVEDAARAELGGDAEAVRQAAGHHLALDLPHELHVHLLQLLMPRHAEQGVLVGELAQGADENGRVGARGLHAKGEDRHERGVRSAPLRPERAARSHAREAGHRAHAAGGDLADCLLYTSRCV